jgi:hypothetical protein
MKKLLKNLNVKLPNSSINISFNMKIYILFFFFILFKSCSNLQKTKYYILTNKAQNITNESLILSKGVHIGNVSDIVFQKDQLLLLTIELKKPYHISKKSEIFLRGGSYDSAPNSIEISHSSEKSEVYNNGDTIKINLDYFKILIDE